MVKVTTPNVRITLLPFTFAWGRLPRSVRHIREAEAVQAVRRAVNRFVYEA